MKKLSPILTIIGICVLFILVMIALFTALSLRFHFIPDAQKNEIRIELIKSS